MSVRRQNLLLIVAVIFLSIVPFFMYAGLSEEAEERFAGADSQAEGVIKEIAPDYAPWFASVWEPPSGEIESLLFALQAALGAGFIGYYIGRARERRSPAGAMNHDAVH